jgi:hypothetical protein
VAEAAKVADNASDDLERANVKALKGVTRPDRNAGDKKLYQQYLRGLDNTGYQLIRGFRELTRKDEISVLSRSENLRQPDLRAFALIGILQGLDASLVAAR